MGNAPSLSPLQGTNVHRTQLFAVLRIGLRVKGDLLPFRKRPESFRIDRRKVYEYIFSRLVVGYEAISLVRMEPLYCALIPWQPPENKLYP